MTNKNAILIIGFILGCIVTDKLEEPKYQYDVGKLIMSTTEKPTHCPICGYKFKYYFDYTEEELQRLVQKYLKG